MQVEQGELQGMQVLVESLVKLLLGQERRQFDVFT